MALTPGAAAPDGAADVQRPARLAGGTIARKFWHAVALRGPKVALRQKVLGIWQETTWAQAGAESRAIAMALAAEGIEPGEVGSILSNTRREWCFADYGVMLAGGVTSGIYPTDASAQCEYLLDDSASRVVFVEDDEQLDKVLEVRARLPKLSRIIVFDMDGLERLDDAMVLSLAAFQARGRVYDAAHPGEFERRLASRRPDDLAILVYTSGTTGKPKGAMISHRNVCHVIENFPPALDQGEGDDKMAFLPLCHVAERLLGQFVSLESGSRLNYVENPETVPENIREIAPTVFVAVPRIWEKLHSAIMIRLHEATPLQRRAFAFAHGLGDRVAGLRLAGEPVPAGLSLAAALARRLLLGNVRRALGVDRMRWALCGAAPISPALIRWYHALGVPMYEGYGMTETTAGGTVNLPGAIRLGTVGRAQPFNEVRIGAGGEILIRGANVFLGYLHQPDKTAETIDADGWLHTGDVGEIDADGFVCITDRMKDIIITAGGKNITPSEIENELKVSPYIADAVVVGDRRPYLTCLVMIDHENVERFAQDRAVPFSSFASLCRAREVRELIGAHIEQVNRNVARVETIKAFRLIDRKLTAEDEELTPTMKLKRKLVNEKYRELIESMYRRE